METPLTDHIKKSDYNLIYEPAEDTFLLLDAIEKDLDFIKSKNPLICLEIGSGSGLIITALANNLKSAYCIASDINLKACQITKETALKNNATLEILQMNFSKFLKSELIDILIFNPPYIVTPSNEYELFKEKDINQIPNTSKNLIDSWAGGIDGCEVINKVIKDLNNILSPKGVFYLLILKENKPQIIIKLLEKKGFVSEILMDRRIPGEHLFVLKIQYRKC